MQTYLAWRAAMHDLVDEDDNKDWKDVEQQSFAVTLMTEALAPTNVFFSNPAAIKRAFETAGMSLVAGARNFLAICGTTAGCRRRWTSGRSKLAKISRLTWRRRFPQPAMRGHPVRAANEKVYERPLVLIPPQINKFYIMDLAPGRSFIEYATKHGVPMFTISWRNPTPPDRDWGLDEYVTACKDAIDAACDISGSPDCNVSAYAPAESRLRCCWDISRRRATSVSTRRPCW